MPPENPAKNSSRLTTIFVKEASDSVVADDFGRAKRLGIGLPSWGLGWRGTFRLLSLAKRSDGRWRRPPPPSDVAERRLDLDRGVPYQTSEAGVAKS